MRSVSLKTDTDEDSLQSKVVAHLQNQAEQSRGQRSKVSWRSCFQSPKFTNEWHETPCVSWFIQPCVTVDDYTVKTSHCSAKVQWLSWLHSVSANPFCRWFQRDFNFRQGKDKKETRADSRVSKFGMRHTALNLGKWCSFQWQSACLRQRNQYLCDTWLYSFYMCLQEMSEAWGNGYMRLNSLNLVLQHERCCRRLANAIEYRQETLLIRVLTPAFPI